MSKWLVWDARDDELDAIEVKATDAEDAAKEWAFRMDHGELYDIARGQDRIVNVIEKCHAEAGGRSERFIVWGSMEPFYYTRRDR